MCQKIGQLLIVGFGGFKQNDQGQTYWNDINGTVFNQQSNVAKDIADQHVGGVILFRRIYWDKNTGQYVKNRNIVNEKQLIELTKALQAYNNKTRQQQKLPPLPLIISIDQEGGAINSLSFTNLPNYNAQALGKNDAMHMNDATKHQQVLDFTRQYALQTGRLLHRFGINLVFAPDVDVNINPVNPIIGALGRSYSDNPHIVAEQAAQMVSGFHQENVTPALKHFPGHGSSTGDTHKGLVDVTKTYQKDKELMPYKILIGNGYDDFIMSTHVINGQIDHTQCVPGDASNEQTWCPGTMSYKTLTELLRNELHFKGVIVSDDMEMDAIAANYPLQTALEKALNAGVDMFIVANHEADNTSKFVDTIARLVQSGKIKPSRIEDAYQHVIAAKQKIIKIQSNKP